MRGEMECPKCGYVMGPFDKECERCNRMGASAPQVRAEPLKTEKPSLSPKKTDVVNNQESDAPIDSSVVPAGVSRMGWCWGAFSLNWIWGIANQVWISLLCLIPWVNLVVLFWLGAKGHELAWKSGRFSSFSQFKSTMAVWNTWGIVCLVLQVALGILLGIGMAVMDDAAPSLPTTQSSPSYSMPSRSMPSRSTPSYSRPSGVTKAQYDQIYTGMSKSAAFSILGPGEELSRTELGGYVTEMYMWEGSGSIGANMNAMFQNGELVSKAQMGLR